MVDYKDDDPLAPELDPSRELSRRSFLKNGTIALAGLAATGAALSPLMNADELPSVDELLQKHYKRLSSEEKKAIFERLESQVQREYGREVSIIDPSPRDDTEFGYVLNIGRCIGCRKCVYACMDENNTSRDPQVQYIRVLKLKKGSIDLESASHDYPASEAADPNFVYMPVQCHQCRKPPCVKVCPVKATWMEKDGVTVVDYNWCIGCRYCQAACPYHARRFNWKKAAIHPDEINPNMGYLTNRLRPLGVMEKCTFCLHRTRKGLYPACHDACPTGARKFGNLRDKDSEIRKIIEGERIYVLKQEVGTIPRFYYVFAK